MPGPKDLDPSSSPRALLGAELRHAREKAGLSQEELGQRLFVSGSFVGQLEAGTRRMQPEYARMLDEALGTGDFFLRNCGAAAKSQLSRALRGGCGGGGCRHGDQPVRADADPRAAPDTRIRTGREPRL